MNEDTTVPVNTQQKIVEQVGMHGAKWLRSKHADWILAAIAFAESVFAPILIDPFLIALIFAQRSKWIRYVAISVVSSVVGGVAGYALGALFFETIGSAIISFFKLESTFADIASSVDANGFVFVLIGAFTPIPYKLVAIASGLLHVDFITFLIASIFGRIFRLGLVGFAAYAVGPKALPVIQRHLHLLAAIVGVLLTLYILYRIF